MRNLIKFLLLIIVVPFCLYSCHEHKLSPIYVHELLAGEPTHTSVILQARLAASDSLIDFDIPGSKGIGRFQLSKDPNFTEPILTNWLLADSVEDYIIKTTLENLEPGMLYYYRLVFGNDTAHVQNTQSQSFKTLPLPTSAAPVQFVMVTGMNYTKFYAGADNSQGISAYEGEDAPLGFHAFETIMKMQPDFFIGNGDNVYYDVPLPGTTDADSIHEMRAHWHRLFSMPRLKQMLATVPTYWLKDDHDHRFNDCDTVAYNERHGYLPSNELGIATFTKQVPVVDPGDADAVTYRTHKINNLVQIWMVEGRDYRSPNNMPNGPDKSIWGEKQKQWLKESLLGSNAVFKILVSPTPMVGPDDAYKTDNHTNPEGFRYEGEAFFEWLKENDFLNKNFYIICGDRHWQYHAVHPSGFEEFSCGALIDQNSRLGRNPGDPESTDPKALIQQIYTQEERSGGFLKVNIYPEENERMPKAVFEFYDEYGELLHQSEKTAKMSGGSI